MFLTPDTCGPTDIWPNSLAEFPWPYKSVEGFRKLCSRQCIFTWIDCGHEFVSEWVHWHEFSTPWRSHRKDNLAEFVEDSLTEENWSDPQWRSYSGAHWGLSPTVSFSGPIVSKKMQLAWSYVMISHSTATQLLIQKNHRWSGYK